jgi:hypothetical protein
MKQDISDNAGQTNDELRARLNAEVGALSWQELQRSFARGVVVSLQPTLDLLDVACAFQQDDTLRVEAWMAEQMIAKASTEDAQRWQNNATEFRAVVVAPWILVQAIDQ